MSLAKEKKRITDFEDFRIRYPISLEEEKIAEVQEFIKNLFYDGKVEKDTYTKYNVTTLLNKENFDMNDTSYFYTKDNFKDIAKFLVGQTNVYFTYNGFRGHRRCGENVSKINCFALDIDFKHQTLTPQEVLDILKNKLSITPMYIVNSGNGYHVYFKLASYRVKEDYTERYYDRVYRALKMYLAEEFKIIVDEGAARPINRVLKVPNTYNYKNGVIKDVFIVYKSLDSIYSINYISEVLGNYYLDILRDEIKKRKEMFFESEKEKQINLFEEIKKPKFKPPRCRVINIKNPHTLKTLLEKRQEDYKKLIELRGNNIEGSRHIIFFLILMNEISLDVKKYGGRKSNGYYKELLQELNNGLRKPQSVTDLNNSIDYILKNYIDKEDGFNCITNIRVIELLCITGEEQKELSIFIAGDERKRRKYLRNKKYYEDNKEYFKNHYQNNKEQIKEKRKESYKKKLKEEGKKTKAEQIKEMKKAINKLLTKGITSNKQIANILGVSSKTVQNYKKLI